MYDKGSIERRKMLCALWLMQSACKDHKRYINSHAYESLRIEFAKAIGSLTSITQAGENNSQFGKHWFTNRNTGECKCLKEAPDETWIKGRNLFIGESCKLINKRDINNEKFKNKVVNIWKDFLNSDFKSINKFNKLYYPTLNLHYLFRTYINDYKKYKTNLTTFNKCPFV